jgi:hypothetical protein
MDPAWSQRIAVKLKNQLLETIPMIYQVKFHSASPFAPVHQDRNEVQPQKIALTDSSAINSRATRNVV